MRIAGEGTLAKKVVLRRVLGTQKVLGLQTGPGRKPDRSVVDLGIIKRCDAWQSHAHKHLSFSRYACSECNAYSAGSRSLVILLDFVSIGPLPVNFNTHQRAMGPGSSPLLLEGGLDWTT